jgi:ABC-type transporter Mla subunit MlaD
MTRRRRYTTAPGQDIRTVTLGALVVVAAIAVLVVAARSSGGLPATSHYDLHVQFPARAGAPVLPPKGSDVRIAGRRVGQTLRADYERGVATLDLQLDRDAGPLPDDTRARVRAQGVLGAKFVDLIPGRSTITLPDEGFIRPADAGIAVSLSEALQTFDAPTRPHVQQMVRGLGGGLAGRGTQLNEGLDQLAVGFRQFRSVIGPLADDGTLAPLVQGAAASMDAFDPVRKDLGPLFAEARDALAPFAAEDRSVAALLDTAPGALSGTRGALARTSPVLVRAERLARAATAFTAEAPDGLDALDAVLRDGRTPLRSASAVLRDAEAAVAPTLRLTGVLDPVLPRLTTVLETARKPSRTLGAYGCDLDRWGRTWRNFLNFGARGQEGPLGPLTILRTTLASTGGISGVPATAPGVGVDGKIDPCEPLRGPR